MNLIDFLVFVVKVSGLILLFSIIFDLFVGIITNRIHENRRKKYEIEALKEVNKKIKKANVGDILTVESIARK